MSQTFMKTVLPIASVVVAIQTGCSGRVRNYPPDDVAVGGGNATGGTLSTGGESSTGGVGVTASANTGGAPTGGTTAVSTGGSMPTGGSGTSTSVGTTSIGGAVGTGGTTAVATGGSMPTGGSTSTGVGTTGMGGLATTGGTAAAATGGSIPIGGVTSTGGATSCTQAAFACGSCLAWDFESSGTSPAPWLLGTGPGFYGVNGATNVLPSHSQFHGGGTSLAVPILIDYSTTFGAEVALSPCQTGDTTVLAGYELTAWVLLSGPALTTYGDTFQVETWGPSGSADFSIVLWGTSPIPTGTWFRVKVPFLSGTQVDHIGLCLSPTSNWVGAMYIDDVTIGPAL